MYTKNENLPRIAQDIFDKLYFLFLKVVQTPSSRLQGQRSWYQLKGLTIRNVKTR